MGIIGALMSMPGPVFVVITWAATRVIKSDAHGFFPGEQPINFWSLDSIQSMMVLFIAQDACCGGNVAFGTGCWTWKRHKTAGGLSEQLRPSYAGGSKAVLRLSAWLAGHFKRHSAMLPSSQSKLLPNASISNMSIHFSIIWYMFHNRSACA